MNRPFYWVRPPQPVVAGMRIGILGGSFNPPHRGHLYASELALRQLRLNSVWWLVSPQNPLKPLRDMANFAERMIAAKRFVRHRRILVSDLEAQFGTRFTIDTLQALIRRFPQPHFVWIMGRQSWSSFRAGDHGKGFSPSPRLQSLRAPAARLQRENRSRPAVLPLPVENPHPDLPNSSRLPGRSSKAAAMLRAQRPFALPMVSHKCNKELELTRLAGLAPGIAVW